MARSSTTSVIISAALLAVLAVAAAQAGLNPQLQRAVRQLQQAPAEAPNVTIAIQLFRLANVTMQNTTILAPTDDAFNSMGFDVNNITDFFNSTLGPVTMDILGFHVVKGSFMSSMLPLGNTSASTLSAIPVIFMNGGPGNISVMLTGADDYADIVQPDILFGSNVVHIIDTVLLPANTTTNLD
ncbi:hypothetical protein V8C86DRAFT_1216525 [Haematococcus lacustris]